MVPSWQLIAKARWTVHHVCPVDLCLQATGLARVVWFSHVITVKQSVVRQEILRDGFCVSQGIVATLAGRDGVVRGMTEFTYLALVVPQVGASGCQGEIEVHVMG